MFGRWSAYAALPLRVVLGLVYVVHGAQKLFGVLGGDGLFVTAAVIASHGFAPAMPLAVGFSLVQLLGGLALLLGALTRWTALALGVERLIVLVLLNIHAGFNAIGGGIEFSLVMLGALLSLASTGAQHYALDARVPVLADWSPPRDIKKAA